ncbi:DUF4916 domain-containing protein [Mycobacterium sp. ITM-2016-00316]|uniref:DUF4916 domain-containing protein n=1 Tax=Mycobacterium sp. ITM-2016-00316 TaxID=2099695 RepID=UPI001304C934
MDFVPVQRGPAGDIDRVGLIKRATPFPDQPLLWCHLGGRIRRSETVAEALARRASTLRRGQLDLPDNTYAPHALMEFFPDPRNGEFGVDPRKHAVSVCYAVSMAKWKSPLVAG